MNDNNDNNPIKEENAREEPINNKTNKIHDINQSNKEANEKNISPENNKKANKLCFISLLLKYVAILYFILFAYIRYSESLETLMSLCLLISFVLMIYVRIKYPKSKFGLIIMILYIIDIIVAIVGFAIFMVSCYHRTANLINNIDYSPFKKVYEDLITGCSIG